LSLKVAQRLIVLSGMLWALFPSWGVPAFAAAVVLLMAQIFQRTRQARRFVLERRDELARVLPGPALGQLEAAPLHYVWPEESRAYVVTLRMASLVLLLLLPVFVLRALLVNREDGWALVPAAIFFVSAGRLATRLDVDAAARDEATEALHQQVVAVATMKALAGQWAPPPD
jgi:hypothetical protein